jgi:hypothetical protein
MQYFKDNQAYATAESYALKFQELFGLVLKFDESEDKKVSLLIDKSKLQGEYDIDTHVGRMKHYFPPLLQEGIEFDIVVS